MFKRLEEILSRYDALSEKLSDPAVVADMDAFNALSKEQADLRETAEKYREYRANEKELEEDLYRRRARKKRETRRWRRSFRKRRRLAASGWTP